MLQLFYEFIFFSEILIMHSGRVRIDYKRWWDEIMGNNIKPGTTASPFFPGNSSFYPFPDVDPIISTTPITPPQGTTPGSGSSATIKIGQVELILEGFFSGVGGCIFIALLVCVILFM